jgi:5'-nucleotidase
VALLSLGAAKAGAFEPAVEGRSPEAAQPFRLTIAHVNDTHLRVESRKVRVRLGLAERRVPTIVEIEIGGAQRLGEAVAGVRRREENVLFLHGGDFLRSAWDFARSPADTDVELWNRLGLNAAVLGNHEFDRGPEFLAAHFLCRARFPLVSANIDVSREPALSGSGRIHPYVIESCGGDQIGIVGLSLPGTAGMSRPGPHVRFEAAQPAVQRTVDLLRRRGVTKIILLSHQGYAADRALARKISGVDIIVGGHTHTLLGGFDGFRWFSRAAYPARLADRDGNPVLIVQAGRWAEVLGILTVEFDRQGMIQAFSGTSPVLAGDSYFAENGSLAVVPSPGTDSAAAEASLVTAELVDTTDYDLVFRELLRKTIAALDRQEEILIVHDRPLAGEQLSLFTDTLEAEERLRLSSAAAGRVPAAP